MVLLKYVANINFNEFDLPEYISIELRIIIQKYEWIVERLLLLWSLLLIIINASSICKILSYQ